MHVPGGMGSFGPSVDEVLKEANEAMTASVEAMFKARKRIAELECALEVIVDHTFCETTRKVAREALGK